MLSQEEFESRILRIVLKQNSALETEIWAHYFSKFSGIKVPWTIDHNYYSAYILASNLELRACNNPAFLAAAKSARALVDCLGEVLGYDTLGLGKIPPRGNSALLELEAVVAEAQNWLAQAQVQDHATARDRAATLIILSAQAIFYVTLSSEKNLSAQAKLSRWIDETKSPRLVARKALGHLGFDSQAIKDRYATLDRARR